MSVFFECVITHPLPGEDPELAGGQEEHGSTLLGHICSG